MRVLDSEKILSYLLYVVLLALSVKIQHDETTVLRRQMFLDSFVLRLLVSKVPDVFLLGPHIILLVVGDRVKRAVSVSLCDEVPLLWLYELAYVVDLFWAKLREGRNDQLHKLFSGHKLALLEE